MKKFKLIINSKFEFNIDNSNELITQFTSPPMYFQENIKITRLLKSIKSSNLVFMVLVNNFIDLYKVYYEGNREIDLMLGGLTYICLKEVENEE